MRAAELHARRERVAELHAQKLTSAQIAARVGCTTSAVCSMLKLMGLTPNPDPTIGGGEGAGHLSRVSFTRATRVKGRRSA